MSWSNALKPPLPLLSTPPAPRTDYAFGQDHSIIAATDLERAKAGAAWALQTKDYPGDLTLQEEDSGVDMAGMEIEEKDGHRKAKLLEITRTLSAYELESKDAHLC